MKKKITNKKLLNRLFICKKFLEMECYITESCGKKVRVNEKTIREMLMEELSRSEVRSMINSELEDFTKDEKLKKTIKNITADVLEDFLDSLWKRKSFWKGTIKRN